LKYEREGWLLGIRHSVADNGGWCVASIEGGVNAKSQIDRDIRYRALQLQDRQIIAYQGGVIFGVNSDSQYLVADERAKGKVAGTYLNDYVSGIGAIDAVRSCQNVLWSDETSPTELTIS
jgi:hypothetical protein